MLNPNRTEAERQAVLAHETALNQILAEVCAQYTRCKFDGNAVFNYQFTADMVSRLDYFHPSLRGQSVLAEITWSRSWWGTP